MQLYEALGLTIKRSKSVLSPSFVVEHLGMALDFRTHAYTLPERKRGKARQLAAALLAAYRKKHRLVPRSTLASVVGFFSSLCLCLPFGRFELSALHRVLSHHRSPQVPLSKPAVRALSQYWGQLEHAVTSRTWAQPVQSVILCTDACA